MKEGWTYKKLGEVCDFEGGSQPPKSEWIITPREGYIRMLQIRDFTKSRNANIEYVKLSKKLRICKEDDILIGRYGASVGKILTGLAGAYNVAIIKSIPDENIILKSYIRRYFESSLFQNILFKVCSSRAAQAGFSKEDICDSLIPVPSLSEQRAIVSRLDSAFAQIDALKANAERQLAEARKLFQKALEEAMTPKEGWEEKTLGEVCDIFGRIGFRGYTTKDLVNSPQDGAISLSPSNIQDGIMDYSKLTYISWFKYEESPEIKIFNGDILLVKTGSSYGKSALVENLPHEATINPQSVVLKNIKIDNNFFAYQLRTNRVREEFNQFVSGTAIPTFSQAKLSTVPVYIPTASTQHTIVAHLDSLSSNVRALEEKLKKMKDECDALKQAMLREVFE